MAGRLLRTIIRERLTTELRAKGLNRTEAKRRVWEELDDETIDEFVSHAGIADAPEGTHPFRDWLKTHWPQILAVILKLLPLLLMFAETNPKE